MINQCLYLCLLLRGEGGGHQGGDEAVYDGTGKSVWGAGHSVQLHQDGNCQE